MASTWFMHHETVAGVIKALLVRRGISPTRQRRGDTKQVEVYRLPKCARSSNERCLETEPFKKAKDSGKVRKRFGKGVSNPPGTKNKEQRITLPSEETLSSRDILPPEDYTPLANASQSDCCFEWVYVYGREFFPAQKANQIAAPIRNSALRPREQDVIPTDALRRFSERQWTLARTATSPAWVFREQRASHHALHRNLRAREILPSERV
jgi:hypothetical protein